MKTALCVLFLFGLMACGSSPKRGVASTQPSCLEKTTKKQCTIDIYGDRHCICIPDESEMYHNYP